MVEKNYCAINPYDPNRTLQITDYKNIFVVNSLRIQMYIHHSRRMYSRNILASNPLNYLVRCDLVNPAIWLRHLMDAIRLLKGEVKQYLMHSILILVVLLFSSI